MKSCPKCGSQINDSDIFCASCGTKFEESVSAPVQRDESVSPKSRFAATMLSAFLGCFGVHNFYLGRIGLGIPKIILFVVGMIFYFVGVFKLAFISVSVYPNDYYNYSTYSDMVFSMIMPMLAGLFFLMGVGIWSLVEFILAVSGKLKDSQGRIVSVWFQD